MIVGNVVSVEGGRPAGVVVEQIAQLADGRKLGGRQTSVASRAARGNLVDLTIGGKPPGQFLGDEVFAYGDDALDVVSATRRAEGATDVGTTAANRVDEISATSRKANPDPIDNIAPSTTPASGAAATPTAAKPNPKPSTNATPSGQSSLGPTNGPGTIRTDSWGGTHPLSAINPTKGTLNCGRCALALDSTLSGAPASALPGGPMTLAEVASSAGLHPSKWGNVRSIASISTGKVVNYTSEFTWYAILRTK